MPPVWPTSWPGAWNGNPHVAAVRLVQDPSFNFRSARFPTNGPYQVAKILKDGSILMRPMKYYTTMTCGAHIKNLIFTAYSSYAALLAAAAARQVDAASYSLSNNVFPELARHSYAYTIHADPGFTLMNAQFNLDRTYNGRSNPLADRNVRLALALAVDKRALTREALGFDDRTAKGLVAWSFLVNSPRLVQHFADPSFTGQWDPVSGTLVSNTGHGRALDDAKALLARTQWKKGFTADFYTVNDTSFEASERGLAAAWAKLGVKVVPHFLPADQLFTDWQHGGILQRGSFQIALFWYFGGADPDGSRITLQSQYIDRRQTRHSTVNGNVAGVTDPLIDRAFDRAETSIDPTVRQRNYVAIQREVNRQAYWMPLYYLPFLSTSDDRIGHFVGSPANWPGWNVYAWTIKR
jgi:ABC-type transport system substrate-binding protein